MRVLVLALALPTVLACTGILGEEGDKSGDTAGGSGGCESERCRDQDGDGFGDPERCEPACEDDQDYADNSDDCDDRDPNVYPGATEVCDDYDVDEDCNGAADDDDDGAALDPYFADEDGDGFGDPDGEKGACEQPNGYVANLDDCDDGDKNVHPDATEICDGDQKDEDCDGKIDDDDDSMSTSGLNTFYRDADNDDFGSNDSTRACELPSGYVENNDDCDDGDDQINPDGQEVCDAPKVDEDCDGWVNDADPSMSTSGLDWYYIDADGDGFGDGALTQACDASVGFSEIDGDCDDAEATTNPDESEVCNDGADNDCDGTSNDCSLDGGYDVTTGTATIQATAADYMADITAAGDQNGDGYDDVLVGAYGAGDGGEAYLFLGPLSGTESTSAANATFTNTSTGAFVGATVLGGFDWSGDGNPDVLVGDYAETKGGKSGAGAMYLFWGPQTTDVSLSAADRTLSGSAINSVVGRELAGGDWDGDGNDDLVFSDADGPSVEVDLGTFSSGSATAVGEITIELPNEASHFALGDADGDGADDLLVSYGYSGSGYQGKAWFSFGGTTSGTVDVESGADATFTGAAANDFLGLKVAMCDLDNDGDADAVAGATGATGGAADSGVAYIWFSAFSSAETASSANVTLLGDGATDLFGHTVKCAGDIDLDGADDVLVSAPYEDSGGNSSGSVYLFYGPLSGSVDAADADADFIGDAAQDMLLELEAVGDVDGDGGPDLAVGSNSNSRGGSYAGAIWLFSGGGL